MSDKKWVLFVQRIARQRIRLQLDNVRGLLGGKVQSG